MNIGIIGAGGLGSHLARALANKRLPAVIANRRGPASLAPLIAELGPSIRAVDVDEAARCEMVVLAMAWLDVPAALAGLPDWGGRIVVDATNPLEMIDPDSPDAHDPANPFAAHGARLVDTGGRTSSEVVRDLAQGARLVKAFNHLSVNSLPEPETHGGRRVLFYSGDDADAKAQVHALIEALGMHPVDLGTLGGGGTLAAVPGGPLAFAEFVKV